VFNDVHFHRQTFFKRKKEKKKASWLVGRLVAQHINAGPVRWVPVFMLLRYARALCAGRPTTFAAFFYPFTFKKNNKTWSGSTCFSIGSFAGAWGSVRLQQKAIAGLVL
jgi:hypothetical protein